MEKFSALSDEFVRMPVWGKEGDQPISFDEDIVVEVAFTTNGPQLLDFAPGEWEYDEDIDQWYARRTMGGLAVGKYYMWARLTGPGVHPEAPILRSVGKFEVF